MSHVVLYVYLYICMYVYIYICLPFLPHTIYCYNTHKTPMNEVQSNGGQSPLESRGDTATRCSTIQHTATHCNTLQHTATHCNTLHRL